MAKKPKPDVAKLKFQNGKTAKVSGVKTISGIKYACVKYGGKTGYVPLDMFVSQKSEAREHLKRQGVGIIADPDWKKVIDAVDRIVKFGKASLIDQPGWAAPYFALKDGTILTPPNSVAPMAIFEKLPRASIVSGSLADPARANVSCGLAALEVAGASERHFASKVAARRTCQAAR